MKDRSIRLTSLDYAILGLIHQQPLSGYGIRKAFENTALGNYSSSPGAIYPALKRLLKFALVKNLEAPSNGKSKFHITENGMEELKAWLETPIEQKDVARKWDEVLLRFAFMENIVDAQQKIIFLETLHDHLITYLKELQEYHRNESHLLPLHGRLAFEFGIESYKTTLKWCKKTLLLFNKKHLK